MTGESPPPKSGGQQQGPLSGWRVIVTRSRAQSPDLARLLVASGAFPIEVPVIEIAEPLDAGAALREALARLEEFDWVVFSSANAVEAVLKSPGAASRLSRLKLAAVGPRTAAALRLRGIEADLVPSEYLAEAVVDAFPAPSGAGTGAVLLPCAARVRDVMAQGLREKGWRVEVVAAYRTVRPAFSPDTAALAGWSDIISFASPSAVTGYLELLGRDRVPPVVACIGPVTARAVAEAGLNPVVVAGVHTAEGLVQALVEWAAGRVPPARQG